MSRQQNKSSGCGCLQIPIWMILLLLGGSYWFINSDYFPKKKEVLSFINNQVESNTPIDGEVFSISETEQNTNSSEPNNSSQTDSSETTETTQSPSETSSAHDESEIQENRESSEPNNSSQTDSSETTETSQSPSETSSAHDESEIQENREPSKTEETMEAKQTLREKNWREKAIRGIYLSRYKVTGKADEETIRRRVRHYKEQGINTIIHGVWGNGCTMYESEVMSENLGYNSCPNKFNDRWLDWLVDEAQKQNMEVYAYFEKGIKIDKNSPIFDLAVEKNWLVPGIDRTYEGVEHYVLDVENPEVANFFTEILVEFVQKYPNVDAVLWDDYLGYHAELPGKVDRTANLTNFVQSAIAAMKEVNPEVNFNLSHHNPYWAEKYFAANWEEWNIDRAFIQAYNDKNLQDELKYVREYNGISITNEQLERLPQLVKDEEIDSILIFPLSNEPKNVVANLNEILNENE